MQKRRSQSASGRALRSLPWGGVPAAEGASTPLLVAAVVAVGFETDMAKLALRMEGGVEEAVEALMASGGVIKQGEEEEEEDAMDEDQGKRRKI